MNKNCPKCGLWPIVKDGKMRGKQRYCCKACKHVFQNKSRLKDNWELLSEYVMWRQTYLRLASKLSVTKRTVQRKIDKEVPFKKI